MKLHTKNYECIIMQVIKDAVISARNALKVFGGWAQLGPPGGTYGAPRPPSWI